MADISFQAGQLLISIPKAIQFVVLIVVIVNILKKKRQSGKEEWYRLTLCYLNAFVFLAIFTLFDFLLYNIAALDFYSIEGDIYRFGYDYEFPSLFIASIMRDISLGSTLLFAQEIYMASLIIKKGELYTETHFINNKLKRIIVTSIGIILVAFDVLAVDKKDDDILVTETWNSTGGIALILIILVLFFSGMRLMNVIRSIDEEFDKNQRKGIGYFAFGILLFSIVSLYWMMLGIIRSNFLTISNVVLISLVFMGNTAWIFVPVLIYRGLKILWTNPTK